METEREAVSLRETMPYKEKRLIDAVFDVFGVIGVCLCILLLVMKWQESRETKEQVEAREYFKLWSESV